MATVRILPPGTAPTPVTTIVNGRSYTCAIGAALDVPDFDGQTLNAAGWVVALRQGTSGPTSARPTAPYIGTNFLDTTVNALIVFDGVTWRNALTGAAV